MGRVRFATRADGPAERMTGFIAHLRLNGFVAGVDETAKAMDALGRLDVTDLAASRLALKTLLSGCREDWVRFDEVFDSYWSSGGRVRHETARQSRAGPDSRTTRRSLDLPGLSDQSGSPDMADNGTGEADGDGTGRLMASDIKALARRDLREFVSPEDIALAEAAAEQIANAIRDRHARRYRTGKGPVLDLRRTIRDSVRTSGEPIRLHRRHKPDRPAQLVALCDVSGSMTVYARVFLAFIKGLMSSAKTTDAYLFHTRLVRITDALRDRDTLRAVNRLSLMADGFGGGTRIGANLDVFNRLYAKRLVSGRSVVMILSDGYDTDPPERIAAALKALGRRGCRILWLNPLKGWKGYEPVARGMAAALPHLDHFAAANTLQCLEDLAPQLRRL